MAGAQTPHLILLDEEAYEETMPTAKKPMLARAEKTGPAGLAALGALVVFCTALLSGCGGKGDKAQTQVAARVNDEEITIHQVNNQLARSGVTGEAAAKEASKKILDALIDQELLVQQAKRKKLDRDPAVMQAIEDTKRQILSQAYLERVVYSHSPPTPVEVKAFYDSHPELFAKRKAYKFHAFAIPKDKFDDGLKSALNSAKTAGDVASILKSRTIDFKENEMQWLAEQMPMEMLPSIAKMKVGDIIPLEQGAQMTLMLLEIAVDSPVDEPQAKPRIEKFIFNSKNKELLDGKLKQLHVGEQITYVGQFAETQPRTAAPETKKPQAPQPRSDDFIQKGLKGLE
jgi:EpsD family peptidyl-prolyl cis-trans isomerase